MGSIGPRNSTDEGETDGVGVDDLGVTEYYSDEELTKQSSRKELMTLLSYIITFLVYLNTLMNYIRIWLCLILNQILLD